MEEVKAYKCSFCPKTFFSQSECLEHESTCDKFKNEYKGLPSKGLDGYGNIDYYIGDTNIKYIWDRIIGTGTEIYLKIPEAKRERKIINNVIDINSI